MRIRLEKARVCALSVMLFLLMGMVCVAAINGSGINGTVVDESGAVIAGASVEIKNTGTGAIVVVTTNESGQFSAASLAPGKYVVTVSAAGFKRTVVSDVEVKAAATISMELKLRVASVSEVVEVTGGEVVIERETAQISQNYDARQVKELPRPKGKQKDAVALLTPGVVNGQSARTNNITIDGVDNNGVDNRKGKNNTEHYTDYGINKMTTTAKDRFSTFAIDVDTASYTIARRKLTEGEMPPAAAVRVEEFINYFKYNYAQPADEHPFAVLLEAAPSPFDSNRHLLRVGIQGREVAAKDRPAAHLTFLVDTSGSMQSADKIGLVKQSLKYLVKRLQPRDTVAITTYAGGVNLVLAPTSAQYRSVIVDAIDKLGVGGGTAMESGINLAYQQAYSSLERGAINRIIICSDGDANIGNTSPMDILKQIEGYVKEGVTVSTIGFGMGNYKDTMMEQFANKGNGNYYYIDNLAQAKRIFGQQLNGTLQVIAKDVKIQVEFNAGIVKRYRLIGYENRDIADEDFRNDQVDAGELGAGHTVTAIYELELLQKKSAQLAVVRLRYKGPEEETAREVSAQLPKHRISEEFSQTSEDFRVAFAAAAFAEVLRGSKYARQWRLGSIADIVKTTATSPERQELITLIDKANALTVKTAPPR